MARAATAAVPGLPVVYLSGYSHDILAPHGVLDVGTVLVEKPFTPEQLAVAIISARAAPGAAGPPGSR